MIKAVNVCVHFAEFHEMEVNQTRQECVNITKCISNNHKPGILELIHTVQYSTICHCSILYFTCGLFCVSQNRNKLTASVKQCDDKKSWHENDPHGKDIKKI